MIAQKKNNNNNICKVRVQGSCTFCYLNCGKFIYIIYFLLLPGSITISEYSTDNYLEAWLRGSLPEALDVTWSKYVT